jgi:hypothetical protein
MTPDWLVLAAAAVGVLGTARATRLVVDDTWPPVLWLRSWYLSRAPEPWHDLVQCAFCLAPWVALPNLAWAVLSDLHWSWWLANGWFAAAYAASMVVVRDTPD